MSVALMHPDDMMEAKRNAAAEEAKSETPDEKKPTHWLRIHLVFPKAPDIKTYDFWRAVALELLATALFCYVGIGTAVSNFKLNDNPNAVLVTAFGFGLAITTMLYVTDHGHFNPAVTLALVIFGECHWLKAICFVIVQTLGGMLGAYIVMLQSPGLGEYGVNKLGRYGDFSQNCTFCEHKYNPHPRDVSAGSAAFAEMMGTFLLVYTVGEVVVNPRSVAMSRDQYGINFAPLAIGLAVFLAHIVLIPITGCGINPARSFGAFFVSIFAANCNNMPAHLIPGGRCHSGDLSIFIIMPFVGAALAAVLCLFVFRSTEPIPEAEKPELKLVQRYPLDRYSIGTNAETKNNVDSPTQQKVPTPTRPISPLIVAKAHQIVPTKKNHGDRYSKGTDQESKRNIRSSPNEDHDDPQFSESKNRDI